MQLRELNFFDSEFHRDPYSQYTYLRTVAPIHRSVVGAWVVLPWAEADLLLRARETSVEDANSQTFSRLRRIAFNINGIQVDQYPQGMINTDAPAHARMRRIVSSAFTPAAIASLQPWIENYVVSLLEEIENASRSCDIIRDLADPVPFTVICKILGMPDSSDMVELRRLSHTITAMLDPILAFTNSVEIAEATSQLTAIMKEAIAWKRRRYLEDDDVLTTLIRANDIERSLSTGELLDNVRLLFIGGNETTTNLIGNGLFALLQNPKELSRIRTGEIPMANVIDELLRFDSPVQFSRRILLKDLQLLGQQMRAGDFVLVALGAANRDEEKFGSDAGELKLDRTRAADHLSFGGGIHYCLGARLAKLEAGIVIEQLVRKFRYLRLNSTEPIWNRRFVLRGLDSLPVDL